MNHQCIEFFVWSSVMLMADAASSSSKVPLMSLYIYILMCFAPCSFSISLQFCFASYFIWCTLHMLDSLSLFFLLPLTSSLPVLSQCALLSVTDHCWVAELGPSVSFCALFFKASAVTPDLYCCMLHHCSMVKDSHSAQHNCLVLLQKKLLTKIIKNKDYNKNIKTRNYIQIHHAK